MIVVSDVEIDSEADVTTDEVGWTVVVASEEVVGVENPPKEKLADEVGKIEFEEPNPENIGCSCCCIVTAAAVVVGSVFIKEETSGVGALCVVLLSSFSNFSVS